MVDPKENLSSGEFLVLSEDDFSSLCPPAGIAISLSGSRPDYYLFALSIAPRVTQRMAAFCKRELGHHLSERGFDCSILTEGITLNLGPAMWQLPVGGSVNLLLRSGSAREESRPLVFESACDKTRTQQSFSFFGNSAILALGVLKPGRHILACADPEEIIAAFEVPHSDEGLPIPAVQINIRKDGQTRCYYWASEGLPDALLEVRSGVAEIDRLILPFNLSLEAKSSRSQSKALILNREQLTEILRGARFFDELKIVSQEYHVRGFATILLVSPKPAAVPRAERIQQNIPNPRTPFQTSLADAVRRGVLPRYVLSAIGAPL
jgi:hypothetical protein